MPKTAILTGEVEGQKLDDSNAILVISVGKDYHEKQKLETTLKLLAVTFKTITIMVADGLQRFTMAIAASESILPEEQLDKAVAVGEEWIKRNKAKCTDVLGNKLISVLRWSEWLSHPDYGTKKAFVDNLYQTDTIFKDFVESSIGQFLRRYMKEGKKFDPESRLAVLSREYILEECAVLLLWAAPAYAYNFLIYPNKLHQAMYNLLQRFVHNEIPHILQSLTINFKDTKQVISLYPNGQQNISRSPTSSYEPESVVERNVGSSLSGNKATFFATPGFASLELFEKLIFTQIDLFIKDNNVSEAEKNFFINDLISLLADMKPIINKSPPDDATQGAQIPQGEDMADVTKNSLSFGQ